SAAGLGTWHRLLLTFNGSTISAAVDGTTVGTVTDTTYSAGKIGLFTGGYTAGDQFANLSVTALAGATGAGPIVGLAGKCVDVNNGNTANGTPVQLYDCNSGASQQWSVQSDGTIRNQGKCLDLYNGYGNGALLEIWDCNGGPNQQWQAGANKTLVNPASGRCLDVPHSYTTNGTQLEVWDCNGGANQAWTLPVHVGPVTGYSGLCLDVLNGNSADGTPVRLATCGTGTGGQSWTVQSDGTLRAL